jgi:predicted nuclease of predicted toxin-antitoxin system
MPLLLILDQGLPRDTVTFVRESGQDCVHVGELGMAHAEDTEIVKLARDRGAVIVTQDADFHALLATSMATGPSVIRLRLQGLDGRGVAGSIARVTERFGEELAKGCLITVKPKKTTCHLLPTGSSD